MFGTGTTVYSVLFFAVAIIVLILAVLYLIRVWRPAVNNIRTATRENKLVSPIVIQLIKTIVTIVVLIVVLTLGWNVMRSITTTMSDYKSPAEISEQKKIQEGQLPEKEVLDKVRTEQKERADVKPHKDAFKSFDESMKGEAEKIKQRSLGGSESTKK